MYLNPCIYCDAPIYWGYHSLNLSKPVSTVPSLPFGGGSSVSSPGITGDEWPVPGRRCPPCLERGDTVWVIPGKCCAICGTPVN